MSCNLLCVQRAMEAQPPGLRFIKHTTLLLAICLAQLFTTAYCQSITLSVKNASLQKVFAQIQKQTNYHFLYSDQDLQHSHKVDLEMKAANLETVLNSCFVNQPLTYSIIEKVIVVKPKKITADPTALEVHTPRPDGGVKGRIVTDHGEPAMATITIKGSTRSTTTNSNGEFVMEDVSENSVLIISGINIEPVELKVSSKKELFITVKHTTKMLEEAIVVAYNTITQKANTAAITVVKGEQIRNLPYRSLDHSLQGMVPGLLITKGTGQPGGGLSNIVLRGISTGTDAFNGSTVRNPLIVIDGIPVQQDFFQFGITTAATPVTNPMAQLNPSDIETITVLKDASAIALYGSKASNGVLLVTTKKGKSGKTVYSFRSQADMARKPQGKVAVLNQAEYLELLYETYKNTNATLWTDQAIKNDLKSKFPYQVSAAGDTSFYPAADWNSELYNNAALTFSNELSMQGGNEKSLFYMNLEHTKQNGTVKNSGYDRKSFRLNFENRPVNNLRLGANTYMSYNVQDYSNPFEDVISYALAPVISPLNPIRNVNGNYVLNYPWGSVQSASTPVANPVAVAEYNINKNTSYRGLAKLSGELDLLKDFTFSTVFGADFMLSELKEKHDPRLQVSTGSSGYGAIREKNTRRANLISTNMLRFNKKIGIAHSVNILAGQEGQIITEKTMTGEARGTNSSLPYYYDLNSPGYTAQPVNASNSKQTMLSYFGQANYALNNAYFLSLSIRRDGSSRFGDQRRWGNYWSAGAAWLVSSEPFMKNTPVSYLKLRGSIGAAGNSAAIGPLIRYDQLNSLFTFLNNPAVYAGSSPGNLDIQWEETFTWDAGVDIKLFDQRVSLTADVYQKKTTNLVYTIYLPSYSGYTSVSDNIGNIKNTGIEISLSTDIIRSSKFKWTVGGNWSTNKNKLVKAFVPLASVQGNLLGNAEGKSFNSFYMPVWAGVNPADGRPQWLDSAGKATTIYNNAKKEFVGQSQPVAFGAVTNTFTLHNLDLSFMLYYQYGNMIYDGSLSLPLLSDGLYPYVNQVRQSLDRWQKPGDIAANPRRMLNNSDGGNRPSTRYLFKGDQLRLQNVMLSYNFPRSVTSRLHVNMLRIFLQGHNLAVWTKYPGQDPDNANVGGSTVRAYPNTRSYSFGLNLNF